MPRPCGWNAGASGDKGLGVVEGLAFICINAQGHIQVASPEAHSLLGYGKNELKGRVRNAERGSRMRNDAAEREGGGFGSDTAPGLGDGMQGPRIIGYVGGSAAAPSESLPSPR